MQQTQSIKLKPSEAANETVFVGMLAQACGINSDRITGYTILKKSLDARSRQQWVLITATVFIDEAFEKATVQPLKLKDVHQAEKKVIVVGAGPAGLFAALRLMEQGIQPIVLERGKDVRARRRDLAAINKEGVVNSESNYCFGEGGAGTYSDGKLYTRSTKRGDVQRILQILVHFGATEKILYEAHPHIGTNKLPHIITAIKEQIIACGGKVLFQKKVTDFVLQNENIKAVKTADGDVIDADAVILATGHSARDIFILLHHKGIEIEAKPFALGVRVEHPQSLIDAIQYHLTPLPPFSKRAKGNKTSPNMHQVERGDDLPPASYSLVQQVEGKGVFSFCMCPGGIIAPAATSPNEIVVNGWSPSKRNNPFANSGIVVSIDEKAYSAFNKQGPLVAMHFQQMVEQKAFAVGGGALKAPAQRMVDFIQNKFSTTLPECSYLPGIQSASLKDVLPPFVHQALQTAFKEWGKKMREYVTNDAVLVATESRTSSPVRIPRNKDTLQHPQIKNLYPCGEGAGYAGGIVSAAIDGERVADAVNVYSL